MLFRGWLREGSSCCREMPRGREECREMPRGYEKNAARMPPGYEKAARENNIVRFRVLMTTCFEGDQCCPTSVRG